MIITYVNLIVIYFFLTYVYKTDIGQNEQTGFNKNVFVS